MQRVSAETKPTTPTRRHGWLRRNGLSLAVLALFALATVGQALTGMAEYNEERTGHGQEALPLAGYLQSGHFVEAIAENWESEFLQMAAFVLLTVFLYQRGSSESKKLDEPEAVDRDPRLSQRQPDTPWPVLRGGWILKVYENSLSLCLIALFSVSFALHVLGGAKLYNEERAGHGEAPATTLEYFGSSQFWFESFQNWQSEFLSLAAMILLTIRLRQRGSPESKPVDAPHSQTGRE